MYNIPTCSSKPKTLLLDLPRYLTSIFPPKPSTAQLTSSIRLPLAPLQRSYKEAHLSNKATVNEDYIEATNKT